MWTGVVLGWLWLDPRGGGMVGGGGVVPGAWGVLLGGLPLRRSARGSAWGLPLCYAGLSSLFVRHPLLYVFFFFLSLVKGS